MQTNTALHNASDTFKLERYKYILLQLNNLNENSFKYLLLFQTLGTAVVSGGLILFVGWRDLKVGAPVAITGIRAVMGLLIALTLFVIFLIVVNVWSWLDFRREEAQLLNEIVSEGFRELPTLKNAWRWQETYIILFLAIATTLAVVFTEYKVIPLIH